MKQVVELISPLDGVEMNAILSDFRWMVSPGETLVLEYSFYDENSEFYVDTNYGYDPDDADYDMPFREGFRTFDESERELVRGIFSDLENIVNIDFIEVDDSPDSEIRIAYTDLSIEQADGLAFLPSSKFFPFDDEPAVAHETSELSGDIWVDSRVEPLFFRETLLHEIGHALGLSHSFDSGFDVLKDVSGAKLEASRDFIGVTVLSYQSAPITIPASELVFSSLASTFMLLDIEALQFLYGAAPVDSSDDVYVVRDYLDSPPDLAELGYDGYELHDYINGYIAISDGGGDNVLIIQGSNPVDIDLSQSGWHYTAGGVLTTGYDDDNLYFAEGTVWSDVYTGSGDDVIVGTDAANIIDTGAGVDQVWGGAGDDQVNLGPGGDDYYYSAGVDVVDGGEGTDVIHLGELSYHEFKFYRVGDHITLSEIAGDLVLELDSFERLAFSDWQFTMASFQSDIAFVNQQFILDDEVPLYQSDIGVADQHVVAAEDAQLYRIYYGSLGRAPDQAGFDFWQGKLDSGDYNLVEVAARFIDSPEFFNLADADADGAVADAEFLDYMYLNVFGREPDEAGYNWWLEELGIGGRDQDDAFTSMVQSDEFVLLTAATVSDYLFV